MSNYTMPNIPDLGAILIDVYNEPNSRGENRKEKANCFAFLGLERFVMCFTPQRADSANNPYFEIRHKYQSLLHNGYHNSNNLYLLC